MFYVVDLLYKNNRISIVTLKILRCITLTLINISLNFLKIKLVLRKLLSFKSNILIVLNIIVSLIIFLYSIYLTN